MDWAERMKNRVNGFCEKEEDKALYHKTRAERFTAAYLIYQALIFFKISRSGSGVYWWFPFTLSLFLSLLYFLSLLDALSSYHRIHRQLDRLFRLEHSRRQTHTSDHFLYVGVGHHQIPTLSELCYRTVMRRVGSSVVVVLLIALPAVMFAACWLLTPPAPSLHGGSAASVSIEMGPICK